MATSWTLGAFVLVSPAWCPTFRCSPARFSVTLRTHLLSCACYACKTYQIVCWPYSSQTIPKLPKAYRAQTLAPESCFMYCVNLPPVLSIGLTGHRLRTKRLNRLSRGYFEEKKKKSRSSSQLAKRPPWNTAKSQAGAPQHRKTCGPPTGSEREGRRQVFGNISMRRQGSVQSAPRENRFQVPQEHRALSLN